jgi:hypothetical protein
VSCVRNVLRRAAPDAGVEEYLHEPVVTGWTSTRS